MVPVLIYKLCHIYFPVVHTTTVHTCHPLFLTKHSLMAPLIWCLIGLVNSSGSVAEANDTGVVYLCRCIPTSRFKKKPRKLNFLMLENTCYII